MPDWGCIHLRSEWFLSTKSNTKMPTWFCEQHEPCKTQCYMCDGKYQKYMLPIVHEGAVRFLDSFHFSENLPFALTRDNAEEFVDLLWLSPDWRRDVFGVKTVQKYNVHSFFFQLIATNILSFQWSNVKREVVCVLTRGSGKKYRFQEVPAWEGFHFRSSRHGAAKVSFTSLLEA